MQEQEASVQGKAVVSVKNPRLWFAKAAKMLAVADTAVPTGPSFSSTDSAALPIAANGFSMPCLTFSANAAKPGCSLTLLAFWVAPSIDALILSKDAASLSTSAVPSV